MSRGLTTRSSSMLNGILIILLPIIGFFTTHHDPAFQRDGKPDLVILGIEYSVLVPEKPKPTEPVGPPRATVIPLKGELAITIGNIGTAKIGESFDVSWEVEDPAYSRRGTSGSSRVNTEQAELPVGGFLVVRVSSYDFRPGVFVKLFLQAHDNLHMNEILPGIDELNYENNSIEFTIPKR